MEPNATDYNKMQYIATVISFKLMLPWNKIILYDIDICINLIYYENCLTMFFYLQPPSIISEYYINAEICKILKY